MCVLLTNFYRLAPIELTNKCKLLFLFNLYIYFSRIIRYYFNITKLDRIIVGTPTKQQDDHQTSSTNGVIVGSGRTADGYEKIRIVGKGLSLFNGKYARID